jgi:hypothetical protein
MWIVLVISHGLLAFLLLGAITHQVVSVWAPARARAGNFVARYRAVGSANYVNAVIVLYIATMIMGAIIYTDYRITARLTLEQGRYWKSFGAFELKEHLIAIGLATLPAYWYFWQPPQDAEHARTRMMLTTLLAFVIWWGFLTGHVVNNIRGLGT